MFKFCRRAEPSAEKDSGAPKKSSKKKSKSGRKERTADVQLRSKAKKRKQGTGKQKSRVKSKAKKKKKRPTAERGNGDSDVVLSDMDPAVPILRSRCYAHVNERYDPARFDYKSYKLEWSGFNNYKVRYDVRVGEGAYGEVFLAKRKKDSTTVCVKTIRDDANLPRIQKEVLMLQLLEEGPDIVKLLDHVRDPNKGVLMLVFEYVRNPDYRKSYKAMTDLDARRYCYRLLRALNYVHSQGIIHRDVKGGNVLYNPDTKMLRVIDWGFAEFYHPKVKNVDWPGTRTYKSPDLFLHYPHYCYSVDLWAVGCMMASLLFQRYPLFRARNSNDKALANRRQMESIVRYLGTDDYEAYLKKYAFPTRLVKFFRTSGFESADKMHRSRVDWHKFVNMKNRHLAVPSGVDLIDRLLVYDHELRLTAREAMAHSYFDPVRNKVENGEDDDLEESNDEAEEDDKDDESSLRSS